MTDTLIAALAAYLPRDRAAQILSGAALAGEGAALIADIAGFTPLTEALARALSPARGAEELTGALNALFAPLIAVVHDHGGSVIKFGGDALIVWFPRAAPARRAAVLARALSAAAAMQAVVAAHGAAHTSAGIFTLSVKIGLAFGPALRVRLGDVAHGYEDVLGGDTLDRMAAAEHHARPGEVVVDPSGLPELATIVPLHEHRDGFVLVGPPHRPLRRLPRSRPGAAPALALAELRAYVPAAVFEALREGRVQPAELKPVVSIFVQFQGVSYEAGAAEAQLAAYFAAAQRAAARYGGRVNRLITGDKGSLLHLIFGAPRALEELELRAARCALELRALPEAMPFVSAQQIGMAVGQVFAGPVGSPERYDYTVMGDAINLSARLMQRAAPGQVLLDADLAARLAHTVALAPLGPAQLKGKAAPLELFALVGELVARPVTTAARVVGRDAELAALRGRLEELLAGRGGVQCVVGELGLGKTHLLAALRDEAGRLALRAAPGAAAAAQRTEAQFSPGVGSLPAAGRGAQEEAGLGLRPAAFVPGQAAMPAARAGLAWAGASAPAYGGAPSGALAAGALGALLGLGAEADFAQLAAACAALLGARRGAAAAPYLARLLGLPLAPQQARELEALIGESLRWRLRELARELAEAAAARGPLVIALDDLQWADPTSLELLEALLPVAAARPLLLLLAARPTSGRGWRLLGQLREQGAAWLELGPLGAPAATAMIGLHAPGLPDDTAARLAERGGGNPLFLTELARAAALAGSEAELPDTIQGLLLAQIDRLPGALRNTLQLAAVLGREVEPRLLAALEQGAGGATDQPAAVEARPRSKPGAASGSAVLRNSGGGAGTAGLEARLAALVGTGFLTQAGAGYSFRHILIQESAYGALLYERRRGHHGAAAAAIERLYPTQIAERSAAIAGHYERAGALGQAARYHGQAADAARLLYANEEADAGYRHLLALLDQGGDLGDLRGRTLLKLAQVRMNAGDYVAAQELYDQAFAFLERAQVAHSVQRRRAPLFRMGADEPETLDPGLCESVQSMELASNLFEGLVELDADFGIMPAAARHWRVENNGLRYVFELRSQLYWSDGAPLTAHDFVFAWRRNLHPQTAAPMAQQLYPIAGAAQLHAQGAAAPQQLGAWARDDTTLEVTLENAGANLLMLLTAPVAFPQPAHLVRAHGPAWSSAGRIVSNGVYTVARWRAGQSLDLRLNRYHRLAGIVSVSDVRMVFGTPVDDWARRSGLDWSRVVDRSDVLATQPGTTITLQYMSTYFVAFACAHPPLTKPEIRRAFALCIDREQLVREVWGGVQQAANGGVVPPGIPGHSPDIGSSFEPQAAYELFQRAGGFPDPFRLAALPGFGGTAEFLAAAWNKQLGVAVELITDLKVDDLFQALRAGRVHAGLLGWDLDAPDPARILADFFHSSSPFSTGWQSATFDRMIEGAAELTDQNERLARYHAADRLLTVEEVAVAPLYYLRAYSLLGVAYRLADDMRIVRGGRLNVKHIQRHSPGPLLAQQRQEELRVEDSDPSADP